MSIISYAYKVVIEMVNAKQFAGDRCVAGHCCLLKGTAVRLRGLTDL